MYRGLPSSDAAKLTHAHSISSQVLCLPIFPDLALEQQDTIIDILLSAREG
jgi:dTDP-4-amino-4,6-dideoxygalactose transaminase